MAYIIKRLSDECLKTWDGRDTRMSHLPLMSSPLPILLIVATYVYLAQVGPKLMENRKPFNIKKLMICYNILQVAFNAIFTIKLWHFTLSGKFSFICQKVYWDDSPDSQYFVLCAYLFVMLKLLDMLDTIFFILRKKHDHVSFLHVYHHAGITLGSYVFGLFAPAGQTYLLGAINTFVHTVMYAYYLLSIVQPTVKSNPTIKRSITTMQMIQFTILVIHFSHGIFFTGNECGYPIILSMIAFVQNLFMLCLFGDFYYKKYIKVRKVKDSK